MKNKPALLVTIALTILAYCSSCSSSCSAAVQNLDAFVRDGQTFLTWQEDGSDWYFVYASEEPITSINNRKWIAKIPRGSNRFRFPAVSSHRGHTDRKYKELFHGKPWADRIQIEASQDASKGLPDGTGLFVHTIKTEAARYYAVTSSETNAIHEGQNSLVATVDEKPGIPGATLVFKKDHLHYFVFFTDFATWNSDGIDDHMHGYSHVFTASIPEKVIDPSPLSVRLHAYSAWNGVFMPYSYPINNGVSIAMFDYSLTWWFGHGESLTTTHGKNAPHGMVVNYTEQRLMQVIRWLAGNPASFPATIDSSRVYLLGGSMGGSGANHITCKQGDIITSGQASKGYTNWSLSEDLAPYARDNRVNVFLGDFQRKFGTLDDNNTTNLSSKRVFDVLNLASWVSDPKANVGYLETANGSIDSVIPFWGVAEFWDALETGKHPYSATWLQVGHSSRLGSGSPMVFHQLRSDETIPAMANASCNSKLDFGFRFMGRIKQVMEKKIQIDNPITHDITGMTLVVGPSTLTSKRYQVSGTDGDFILITEGNLLDYTPPVTAWQKSELKRRLNREPSDKEIREQAAANKSRYLVIDGDPEGTRNGHIAWSSSHQNFDKSSTDDDIVDTENQWCMNFRLEKNQHLGEWKLNTATVDITPRRCQKFKPPVGTQVRWENWDHSSPGQPERIASGEVSVDRHGLITVPEFIVGKRGLGNRLILTPVSR